MLVLLHDMPAPDAALISKTESIHSIRVASEIISKLPSGKYRRAGAKYFGLNWSGLFQHPYFILISRK